MELDSFHDQCRRWQSFSAARFAIFTLLFLIMFPGSIALFILLYDYPYGIQLATIVTYTCAVCIYSFARTSGARAFLIECPVVQSQLPRLYRRHAAFLAVLFVFQTLMLFLKPHLSDYWLTASRKHMPPYITVIVFFGVGLALTQIMTNRSLLKKAHAELSSNC